MSPNQGQIWTLMTGGIGNPLIFDTATGKPTSTRSTTPTPNGAEGRIALAVPAPTGNAVEDADLRGWLYAAVATPTGGFDGLFVTKDFGENWTEVNIPTLPPHRHPTTRPSPPTPSARPTPITPITDHR